MVDLSPVGMQYDCDQVKSARGRIAPVTGQEVPCGEFKAGPLPSVDALHGVGLAAAPGRLDLDEDPLAGVAGDHIDLATADAVAPRQYLVAQTGQVLSSQVLTVPAGGRENLPPATLKLPQSMLRRGPERHCRLGHLNRHAVQFSRVTTSGQSPGHGLD